MSESWNRKIHPVVVGMVIGHTAEKGPLRITLYEDDEHVTLDLVLAVGTEVGQTAARLPGKGDTVKVTLHLADKTALQITGRVDLVGQVWGLQPIGEARVRIRGKQVVVMPSLVVAGAAPKLNWMPCPKCGANVQITTDRRCVLCGATLDGEP